VKAPLFSAKRLSYSINGKPLLRNFSLDVFPGELVVILGRNGTGKSTFLNLATGELKPSTGTIDVFARPLEEQAPKALATRRAVLAQATALAFDYSVLDVVLLGRLPHQKTASADEDRTIALECLSTVEMLEYRDRGYLSLSGGEQQRVHLARVLAQIHGAGSERLLFLDEPTNNLDLRHQHQTLRLVKELTQAGSGAVAVLHDLNLAAQYADRVVLLKHGSMLVCGTPDEVLTEANIHSAYDFSVTVGRHPLKHCPLVA
jgi:iron complex transport system ATP-binding protein